MTDSSKKLIDLEKLSLPLPDRFGKALKSKSEKWLGVSTLNQYYRELKIEENFYHSTLKKLNIRFEIDSLELIPEKGGLVIMANHPFGAVEGVILGAWLSRIRPDFKFIGNGLLQMIQEMKDDVIAVNPFGQKSSIGSNAAGLREAIRWAREGHVLVIFPAGEVSSLQCRHLKVEDPKWSKHIGWLVEKTEASVLPLFFKSRNSNLFQGLGLIHPILRTMMLPRELLNKSGQCIQAQAGRLIHHKNYRSFKDAQVLIDYFRHQTYALSRNHDQVDSKKAVFSQVFQEDVVAPRSAELLMREIKSLNEEQKLLERGKFVVYAAKSEIIPETMHEIGRLREVTFRAAGEGTGKSIDLDKYDDYYVQLFLWDKETNQLVGAYRIGHTKEILEKYGPQGMYSSSLFKIKKKYWTTLSDGMEMGRSFIRQEYQRSPMCLPLLWHGICQHLLRNQPYHSLYGCVSICSEYQKSSVDLMIDYLKKFRPAPQEVSQVKPRVKHVQRQRHLRHWLEGLDPSNMNPEQLSQMISMLEPDGKGIPVLLRHYLKAGSKILCFNVDPDFSDVVDGLIYVDLLKTDSKLIGNFMKQSEAQQLKKLKSDDERSLA